MKLTLIATVLILILLALAVQPASGEGPDLPATMAVERATATAVYLYWRQDYRMLRACMTEVARAERRCPSSTPRPDAAPSPTPLGARLGSVAP